MEHFTYKSASGYKASELQSSILRTLAYFDVFRHPLTAAEIYETCDIRLSEQAPVRKELDALTECGAINRKGIYYHLGSASGIDKRKEAIRLHPHYLGKAFKYSRIISKFPFVRGISISGSVAKGAADSSADVDYFIITAPNRVWICRTLLALFKRLVLLNSSKYFCINYFVDTENLEIPDKNIFTATEIAFLLPTYNYAVYEAFMQQNDWIDTYYPNKGFAIKENVRSPGRSWIKNTLESLMHGTAGDAVDRICLRFTQFYRKRKFNHLTEVEFKHRLHATKGVSKHHPNSFQSKVLSAYERNLNTIYTGQSLRSVI
jgi:hypothetical protein